MKDIFIACVDGLKGFPQAIETMFPQAQVQTCIVHLVRASLNYVSWKERKQVAADLKTDLPRRDRRTKPNNGSRNSPRSGIVGMLPSRRCGVGSGSR